MKVSAQYAQEHLADLLSAAESGEEVEIAQPGQRSFRLTVVIPDSTKAEPGTGRRGLWGSAKGQIWLADDWDSPETNRCLEEATTDRP